MPKMKTNKSVSKRIKKTGTGKFTRNKSKARHLMTGKTRKQKRGFKEVPCVHKTDAKKFEVLIPYA